MIGTTWTPKALPFRSRLKCVALTEDPQRVRMVRWEPMAHDWAPDAHLWRLATLTSFYDQDQP